MGSLTEYLVLHYVIDVSDEDDVLFETLLADCDTMVEELIRRLPSPNPQPMRKTDRPAPSGI